MTMLLIKPILYPARERGPNKISFSTHPKTSPCYMETGFDSRVMQEDAQNWCILLLDRV